MTTLNRAKRVAAFAAERWGVTIDPADVANLPLTPEEENARRVAQIRREERERRRKRARCWFTVYKLYDAKGDLLYVGISAAGLARLARHALQKSWWRQVAQAEFEHVKGHDAAVARELELIRSELPRWNVAGKPTDLPEPQERAGEDDEHEEASNAGA